VEPNWMLVILTVLIALSFDVINGFHDAANSIATVVSTRVLSPRIAVIWAAFFNFVAMFIFAPKVANTISKIVKIDPNDPTFVWVVLTGLVGAIVWDLITWRHRRCRIDYELLRGPVGCGCADRLGLGPDHPCGCHDRFRLFLSCPADSLRPSRIGGLGGNDRGRREQAPGWHPPTRAPPSRSEDPRARWMLGVPNPLYDEPTTLLLFGDANATVTELLESVPATVTAQEVRAS
jgi:hypothetical protein